jgi:hypothetical protein
MFKWYCGGRRHSSMHRHRRSEFERRPIERIGAVQGSAARTPWPRRTIAVVADASADAIGTALQQLTEKGWQPLSFFSMKLTPTERKYSAYDRRREKHFILRCGSREVRVALYRLKPASVVRAEEEAVPQTNAPIRPTQPHPEERADAPEKERERLRAASWNLAEVTAEALLHAIPRNSATRSWWGAVLPHVFWVRLMTWPNVATLFAPRCGHREKLREIIE